jgi:hypothetical protein
VSKFQLMLCPSELYVSVALLCLSLETVVTSMNSLKADWFSVDVVFTKFQARLSSTCLSHSDNTSTDEINVCDRIE